jgi:hypothetical protein
MITQAKHSNPKSAWRKGVTVKQILVLFVVALLILFTSPAIGEDTTKMHPAPGLGDYDVPFYPGGTYMSDVQSPDEFFGFKIGSRPVTQEEVLRYFRYLDTALPNASLQQYGKTFEGRALVYLTVTSEENAGALEDIRSNIQKLADPRMLGDEDEAKRIIDGTPAVAWMAYAIHGDELSSTDAAVQLAYQLLAGTDGTSRMIRDSMVVCIDPLENPDGRTRWVQQMTQFNPAVTNTDAQSIHHRGVWPWGRGNHYLFDLNRDWFSLVHSESRARVKAILSWNPQFMVDCHEMGSGATYLFSPPREPFNPYMIGHIHKWWEIVAKDQGRAFDKYGWSYYTREWNEEFFPGYGSSWSIYIGAVGMLYEQARTNGSQVKRADGTTMTYRETVHHQFIGSMANLTTVASNRRMLLEDYYQAKKWAVSGDGVYFFPPTPNKSRLTRFAGTLQGQGIEVFVAQSPITLRRARSRMGEEMSNLSLPQGTLIVPLNQPLRHLIETILAFDIRFETGFLEVEKREILKKNQTKLYEVTAWSLPFAYNLESYSADKTPRIDMGPFVMDAVAGGIEEKDAEYGYILPGTDDRSYKALAALLDKGIRIRCAKEPFEVEGRKYPRGSYLIRLAENPDLKEADLIETARREGVVLFGVTTALATSGPDLGGNEFALLKAPRIAVVGGSGISTTSFGALWHLLDVRLNLRSSMLDMTSITGADFDKYNTIVLPTSWGGPDTYERAFGKGGIAKLKEWVEDGGTLIGVGAGAAFLADTSVAISQVRQRRQVLKDLGDYKAALDDAMEAEAPLVDSLDVWEAKSSAKDAAKKTDAKKADLKKEAKPDLEAIKREDEKARKLRPRGAILGVHIDEEHWLGYGCGEIVPILVSTGYTYLAKDGVQIAARFHPEERLRISGLLWPEARKRWSETPYATREAKGKGQVILFATRPNFRGYFHGGERMLLNALLLGPGFGTRHEIEW